MLSTLRFVFVALGICPTLCGQEVITLTSGAGPIGGTDPNITMLVGPVNSGFPAAFTLTDFAMAHGGPPAVIPTPNGGWSTNLPLAPGSQWISTVATGDQHSALFAMDFTVTSTVIAAATLDLTYAVDDFLGDGTNAGLFLNMTPIPGSTVGSGALYIGQHQLTGLDVTPMIMPGVNTLYVYQRDFAGAAGIRFGVTLTIHDNAHLSQPLPLVSGGVGLIVVNANPALAGSPFAILPSTTPALSPGTGIPLAPGHEFLLPLADPLLQFALFSPSSAALLPGMTGTISPINGAGATPVMIPAGNAGLSIDWQAVLLSATSGAPLETTPVLSTTIQ